MSGMGKNASILGVGFPIQLQEGEDKKPKAPKQVQLLKTGRFNHPFFGPFNLTPKTFKQFKENFDKGVKGVDPALDFKHDVLGEAAAWLTGVILKQNGNQLWAEVEWTDVGRTAVENKRFRYISADFSDSFKEQETGKVFGNVLNGGTLTNRPFLKNMKPTTELVQLAEIPEGEEMKTAEELQKDLEAEKKKTETLEAEKKTLTESNAKLTSASKKAKADPPDPKVTKLSEPDKKLADENAKLKSDLAERDKKDKFDKMLTDNTVVEAQREPFMKDDFAKFAENAAPTQIEAKGSAAKGTEVGNAKSDPTAQDTPIQDKVIQLADDKVRAEEKAGRKLNQGDAIDLVLSENSKLNEGYEKEIAI